MTRREAKDVEKAAERAGVACRVGNYAGAACVFLGPAGAAKRYADKTAAMGALRARVAA